MVTKPCRECRGVSEVIDEFKTLKHQHQQMQELLKEIEWCDSGGCLFCNHHYIYDNNKHSSDCKLAKLLYPK